MFRLKTLGGALIEGPEGVLTGAATQRRRLALLALMAANSAGLSRDRLVGMLWPESDEERARHALAQLLYSLRRDFGGEVVAGGATTLRLDTSLLSSDARDLEAAFERRDYEQVVDLYQGPFLDGFYLNGCPEFERWVDEERGRIAYRMRVALEKLAGRARDTGDTAAAVVWTRRLATVAPLDSRVALGLMRALVATGDRLGAIRHARIHERLLADELGTAPDAEVTSLAASLATAVETPPGAQTPPEPRPVAAPAATPGDRASDRTKEPANELANVGTRPAPPRFFRLRTAISAAGLVVAAIFLALGLTKARAARDRAWVLIADAENASGDPVFDRAVPVALAAALAQSEQVYVVPPERIRIAFERMRRPRGADSSLGERTARELAQREGVRVVLVPSVVRADQSYEIGARLEDPATGGVLGAITVRAATRADVIDALDRLGRKLRRQLGESALSVMRHSVALPLVTTASLDALKKYADGGRAFESNHLLEAETLWKGAVEIDTSFAAALAALGMYNYWINRQRLGDEYFTRALAHIQALPEREQVMIRAKVEGWQGNRAASTARLEAYLTGNPNDLDALTQLGYDYMRLRKSGDAAAALRRAIALDSMDYTAFLNLATAEKQLGRYRDAIAHYHRAFALMPSRETANDNLNLEYGSTYVLLGFPDSAAAVFSKLLTDDKLKRARGLRSLAFLAMSRGQYNEASRDLAEAITLTSEPDAAVSHVRNRLLLAAALDRLGREREVAQQLDSAYATTRRIDAEPTLLFWVGKALARAGAERQAAALVEVMKTRVHPGSRTDAAAAEGLEGEVLLARHMAKDAIPHLEAAFHADSTSYTLESLAYGAAASHALERADSLYRLLARHPDFGWEGQEYGHMALYEVGRTDELLARNDAAVNAYQQFLDVWRDAEPAFPPVVDARDRIARLRLRDVPR